MRRKLALRAEIFQAFHDSTAKDQLPQAVDENTRWQRVIAVRNPAGKIEARQAALLRRCRERPLWRSVKRIGFTIRGARNGTEAVPYRKKPRHRRPDNLAAIIEPVPARQHSHRPRLDRD